MRKFTVSDGNGGTVRVVAQSRSDAERWPNIIATHDAMRAIAYNLRWQ